jgi:hypothetical protein
MTGKQWLKSVDPEEMGEFYGERFTERKARLIMLACCQRHPKYLKHKAVRPVIEALVDHYADPKKPDKAFDSAKIRKLHAKLHEYGSSTRSGATRGVAFGVIEAAEPKSVMKELDESFEYLVFSCTYDIAAGVENDEPPSEESARQAGIMREVLGNPFTPVVFEPVWRTDTVAAMARQIYETEDFSAMPILADALQDAGCEQVEILKHCRDEKQTHVRGCWVLDLILGKT